VDAHRLGEYGIDYAVLTAAQLRELEPHVSEAIVGAINFRGSPSSSDPSILTKAYADLSPVRAAGSAGVTRVASLWSAQAGAYQRKWA
jgi:hypothetical protein